MDDWIEEAQYSTQQKAVPKEEKIDKEMKKIQNIKDEEFVIEEEKGVAGKCVITIYGNKGEGKTMFALSFPGKIAALSFDRKTGIIKANFYREESNRIKVYDAVKYLSEDPEEYVSSSLKTYKYVIAILNKVKEEQPDWVVIDGVEILTRIAEQAMRKIFNLTPFQGIPNLSVWKYRRLIMRNIHNKAVEACKRGVIYTTYTEKDEIIEEGNIVSKKDVPKYFDILLWETDVVMKAYSKIGEYGKKFFIYVDSSKIPTFETGKEFDVTFKRVGDIFKI